MAPSSASLADTSASAAPDSDPTLADASAPRRKSYAAAYSDTSTYASAYSDTSTYASANSNTASDPDTKAYADGDSKAYAYAISDAEADPKRNA
jgi:hypothetical protein